MKKKIIIIINNNTIRAYNKCIFFIELILQDDRIVIWTIDII